MESSLSTMSGLFKFFILLLFISTSLRDIRSAAQPLPDEEGASNQAMAKCKCGAVCVIRTSTTKRNPGRAFYACPLQGPRSGFISWVDEEEHGDEAEIKNERFKIRNQELEVQNRNLKTLLIISWFVFFGIVVYKL